MTVTEFGNSAIMFIYQQIYLVTSTWVQETVVHASKVHRKEGSSKII